MAKAQLDGLERMQMRALKAAAAMMPPQALAAVEGVDEAAREAAREARVGAMDRFVQRPDRCVRAAGTHGDEPAHTSRHHAATTLPLSPSGIIRQ